MQRKRKPGRPKRQETVPEEIQPQETKQPAVEPQENEPQKNETVDLDADWRNIQGDPQELFETYIELEIKQLKKYREHFDATNNAYMVQRVDRLITRYDAGERSGEFMKSVLTIQFKVVG